MGGKENPIKTWKSSVSVVSLQAKSCKVDLFNNAQRIDNVNRSPAQRIYKKRSYIVRTEEKQKNGTLLYKLWSEDI